MDEPKPVRAKLIIEMLGSPKEHLAKTLRDYLDTLKDDTAVTVISEDVAEPKERGGGLFSTFVELEMEFPTAFKLIDFCFEAMPSSVEIISPEVLTLPTDSFSSLLNDLQARLHTVDMAMKQITAQKNVLDKNAMSVLHNFIRFILKDGGKTADEMAPLVGLTPEQLERFLASMLDEGPVRKEGKTYVL